MTDEVMKRLADIVDDELAGIFDGDYCKAIHNGDDAEVSECLHQAASGLVGRQWMRGVKP